MADSDIAESPGKGRSKPRRFPKGRPLDSDAFQDVRALLGDIPRRRDLLIECLHVIQDARGHLSARHLRALAEELRVSQAEVFEVASFYHHFDIVKDGEDAPAPVTIRVCESLSCNMAGAETLIEDLKADADPERVRVVRVPCIGRCAEAPAAAVGKRAVAPATAQTALGIAASDDLGPQIPNYVGLDLYRQAEGYRLLEACRAGDVSVDSLIAALSDSGLRGMGGAGFPAGKKWEIVRSFPAPRLVTVNGDEGEPGTFKDRHYLERDPHRMLEGALIAAYAVEAELIVIYMRDEYPGVHEILTREIAALKTAGLTGPVQIELRRGAGAYICGEESAMLESIEGKRGLPRHRPPYIAETGLYGQPTLNHNVETLWWVRDIVEQGADWFAGLGKPGHKGLRSYSVSGRVKNPGVKVAPAGISLSELIDKHCGGMASGHRLAAFLPGGASGGIFPASMAGLPLDFGTFEPHGGFMGSHAVVVMSDQDDPKAAALNLLKFFMHESCGQCTPCRAGTDKMVTLLEAGNWDEVLIGDLEQVMRDASICGLGQAAPNPVRSVFNFFMTDTPD